MTARPAAAVLAYGLDRPLSGIGRYSLELIRALHRLDGELQLVLLAASREDSLVSLGSLWRVPLRGCSKLPGLVTMGNVWIPWMARRLHLDLVHDPSGITPFLLGAGGAHTVVTVHDVFAWSCPGHSTIADTLLYRHWLPRLLPRVDAVITDSQASRADIVRYLQPRPERVHVVYPGVSTTLHPASEEDIRRSRTEHRLPEHYILFVGSVEKRKNVHGLLRAYARLQEMGEQRPLVVVGVHRPNAADLSRLIQQLELDSHVVLAGYLPDADLSALYSGADLFVFPSLYEGFGFPPLEAMACGTPVVCSNNSSLPEVVGDAAVTVDPRDVEALAGAMRHVLSDTALREEMRAKGLQRARMFTWERTARETVAVYRQVLQRRVFGGQQS